MCVSIVGLAVCWTSVESQRLGLAGGSRAGPGVRPGHKAFRERQRRKGKTLDVEFTRLLVRVW
jgi:hypothetical protein